MRVVREEILTIGTDELHDLVLALTRSVGTSENNGKVLPVLVLLDLLQQKEMNHLVKLLHEARTR